MTFHPSVYLELEQHQLSDNLAKAILQRDWATEIGIKVSDDWSVSQATQTFIRHFHKDPVRFQVVLICGSLDEDKSLRPTSSEVLELMIPFLDAQHKTWKVELRVPASDRFGRAVVWKVHGMNVLNPRSLGRRRVSRLDLSSIQLKQESLARLVKSVVDVTTIRFPKSFTGAELSLFQGSLAPHVFEILAECVDDDLIAAMHVLMKSRSIHQQPLGFHLVETSEGSPANETTQDAAQVPPTLNLGDGTYTTTSVKHFLELPVTIRSVDLSDLVLPRGIFESISEHIQITTLLMDRAQVSFGDVVNVLRNNNVTQVSLPVLVPESDEEVLQIRGIQRLQNSTMFVDCAMLTHAGIRDVLRLSKGPVLRLERPVWSTSQIYGDTFEGAQSIQLFDPQALDFDKFDSIYRRLPSLRSLTLDLCSSMHEVLPNLTKALEGGQLVDQRTSFILDMATLDDACTQHLKTLVKFNRNFSLRFIDDRGVSQLLTPAQKVLCLGGTKISAAGMMNLGDSEGVVEILDIERTSYSASDLSFVTSWPHLKVLILNGGMMNDTAVSVLTEATTGRTSQLRVVVQGGSASDRPDVPAGAMFTLAYK